MRLCSPISDGIRWLLGRHGIIEDIDQELAPLVTPSTPSYPEGLNNEGHDTHDLGEHPECTEGANRACIGFRYLLLGFLK